MSPIPLPISSPPAAPQMEDEIMGNEITSTHEMAEAEWDGGSEHSEVDSDLVATKDAEGKGIEFHVSMRDYTMSDMEALIVEAAARTIVGRHNDHALAKQIEAKCIEMITAKADKALASVTHEIIDQPITPKFAFMKADEKPMTMREFIGLTGREYLTTYVDSSGKPTSDRHYNKTRIKRMVEDAVNVTFKREIEKATNAAIAEIQLGVKARHDALIAAEKARIRDAITKATA